MHVVGRCFWVLVLVTPISDRGDCPQLNDRAGIGQVTVAFVVLHRTTHRTLYSHGTVVMITALQLLLEPSE